MQYKDSKKIMIDQRKLETLFRIGCPDNLIIELLKTRTFTPTGDSLIDDNLESLLDYRYFVNNGWGGKRAGAGRKSQKSEKNNHLENQDENHLDNQDANQDKIKFVDKDIDIDNKESIGGVGEKRETIDENTPFKAGGQMWAMPLQFRKLAKKYWAESEIREIEIEHSCHEEPVELTINDLLTIKPPKPKKKDFVPPTLAEWCAFCKELKLDLKRLESIYYGYSENNWRDSHGNQIKNWKMKIRQVWDKPENKDPFADIPSGPEIADKSKFVRAKPL